MCCALSLMVALLLASLLSAHVPLAFQNMTTIEENYDNMPNPFDYGPNQKGKLDNLSQVFGAFGVDWFFPLDPWHPTSDGVSYPRPSDPMIPQPMDLNLNAEDFWRLRYATQKLEPAMDVKGEQSPGIFNSMVNGTWWRFGF
jgi:hypothetical protein